MTQLCQVTMWRGNYGQCIIVMLMCMHGITYIHFIQAKLWKSSYCLGCIKMATNTISQVTAIATSCSTWNSQVTITSFTTWNSQVTITGFTTWNSQVTITGFTTWNSQVTITGFTTCNSQVTITGFTTWNSQVVKPVIVWLRLAIMWLRLANDGLS